MESSGELLYDAPDRLEKRTREPRLESLVLVGPLGVVGPFVATLIAAPVLVVPLWRASASYAGVAPAAVLADVDVLRTLPIEQRRSGLAEAIKHGVIADAGYLAELDERMRALVDGDATVTLGAVARSVEIKLAIVRADTHEHGMRKQEDKAGYRDQSPVGVRIDRVCAKVS